MEEIINDKDVYDDILRRFAPGIQGYYLEEFSLLENVSYIVYVSKFKMEYIEYRFVPEYYINHQDNIVYSEEHKKIAKSWLRKYKIEKIINNLK